MAVDTFFPPRVLELGRSKRGPEDKAVEKALLKKLTLLYDEGKRKKDEWVSPDRLKRDLRLYRGEIKPRDREPRFAANFIEAFLERMASRLTDNRPIVRIEPRKDGLKNVAKVAEKAIRAIWEESNVQRNVYKMAFNAGVNCSAGIYTGYDPTTDDAYLEVLRINQVVFDPMVIEAADVHKGSYLFVDRVIPLDEARARFPGRADALKADADLSDLQPASRRSVLSPLTEILRTGGVFGGDTTLPRVKIREAWLKDWRRKDDGTPEFPGGRRSIYSPTQDILLWDDKNHLWDGVFPVDWYDWRVDPEHAFGRCLIGETMISTESGIIPIQDGSQAKETESGRILDLIPQGRQPVFELTTDRGYRITGTSHHRVQLTDKTWIELGQAAGHCLALIPPRFAEWPYICEWQDVPCATTRMEITPAWGRFLGYFMGDGSYYGRTSSIEVACFEPDEDVIEDVSQLLRHLFGQPATARIQNKAGERTRCVRVRISGQALFRPLLACEAIRLAQYESARRWRRWVHVPQSIWRSPRPVVREFLRGLFETDGSADLTGDVSFAAADDDFLHDVQLLLLGFGITSRILYPISRRGGREWTCPKLTLTRLESEAFLREIGFISARKRARNAAVKVRRLRSCKQFELVDRVKSVKPCGEAPVYDLVLPPPHLFGANGIAVHNSEPDRLMLLQTSFNQIMDGLVENQLLSNFLQIIGDYDSLDDRVWKQFQNLAGAMILRKKNRNAAAPAIVPPPQFGADKINLAKQLFTFAQLLTGETDVALGEVPGSLQSGRAIEGLQEGSGVMTRARASRLEDFLARVGQKLLARIFQFWPSDRVVSLVGPTGAAVEYAIKRSEFFLTDDGKPVKDEERAKVFRDMRFFILPGSSAPGSRQQRALLMIDLVKLGAAGRIDVLQAADFPEPESMLERGKKEMLEMGPLLKQMGSKK